MNTGTSFLKSISYILVFVCISGLTACGGDEGGEEWRPDSEHVEFIRSQIAAERTIIHAAGAITSEDNGRRYTYTNSYPALVQSYEHGNRIFEIDFMESADGYLVCAHDGEESGTWAHGLTATTPMTKESFLKEKVFGQFQTMSLDELAEFMRAHPDVLVVTDVKDDNEKSCNIIRDTYPDLVDRFIVQIYHTHEYEKVANLGFKNIIYTLYRTTPGEQAIQTLENFIATKEIVGLTFHHSWVEERPQWFAEVASLGIPLYVHTVNDSEAISKMLSSGVSAIYTDKIDNEWMRQEPGS